MSSALTLLALAVVASLHQRVGISEGRAPEADVGRSILELQPFRQTQSLHIRSTAGREGLATLVNLNPSINAWYVLEVTWKGGAPKRAYHLENTRPAERTLRLDEAHPSSLMITDGAARFSCDLFAAGPPDLLEQGRGSPRIFSPLCESQIYLRNSAVGHRTGGEVMTEFFRDRVWGGESVIDLGHQLLSDSHRQTGTLTENPQTVAAVRAQKTGPLPALINPAFAGRVMAVPSLGISAAGTAGGSLTPGAWYATATSGSYVSVFQPNVIAPQILKDTSLARTLDSVEGASLCYLVAFDLDRFRLGYARGTEPPEVDWSEHITPRMRNSQLPGPDGIGDITPLVGTGLLPPDDVRRTVATFTAGFKRAHGAFLSGDLSLVNHGSHYGFIENGVVFSRLQPGLATIFVRAEGGDEDVGREGRRAPAAHQASLRTPQSAECVRRTTSRMRRPSNGATVRRTRKGSAPRRARRAPTAPGTAGTRAARTPSPTACSPGCESPLKVYDLNGNAAEHMNLPLNAEQMSSRGSRELGYTEMKGSWFVFDAYRAHEDWCRWRAPFWHGSKVMDERSHANYHLGFRCCKTLE